MSERIPAVVLGGTGYVAGELLRLIAAHPQLRLAAVLSDSAPGQRVADAFPHLAAAYPHTTFSSEAEVTATLSESKKTALFSAAPHGVSAGLVDRLLAHAESRASSVACVDISADFRLGDVKEYEAVYAHTHGAPLRLPQFTCAVPEHLATLTTPHVAHPGCFATAALLAAVPLVSMGYCGGPLFISGVTGSTGSGRTPTLSTHHPLRHADFYAYGALAHRHTPEIAQGVRAAAGKSVEVQFVPHSGPFARGIHVTVQTVLARTASTEEVVKSLREFYSHSEFVRVLDAPPRVKDVTASNFAHLGVVANARGVAVMCAIDNLVKGAAGGSIQWMNRLLGWDHALGLTAPAPGWT